MTDRTVVCVLNMGDFRKRPYQPHWVQKLRRMVARNLGEHRFVVLSNVEVPGVETIMLRRPWEGWWSKLEAFKPGLFDGRVLMLDLDVLITDDLTPLFNWPGQFVAMKSEGNGPTRIQEGKRVTSGLNSGTMAWTPCEQTERLYTEFHAGYQNELRGDQDWITEQYPDPEFFPTEWFIRLKDCPNGPPPGVRVLHCMPLKNNRAADRYAWVRELWG